MLTVTKITQSGVEKELKRYILSGVLQEGESTITVILQGNKEITDTFTVMVVAKNHVHEWSEWQIVSYSTCVVHGEEKRICLCGLSEVREMDLAEHTPNSAVKENVTTETCAKDGSYEEVVYCVVCNAELSREQIIVPAHGNHTPQKAVEENRVDATCLTSGSFDSVVYCSVCNGELSRARRS